MTVCKNIVSVFGNVMTVLGTMMIMFEKTMIVFWNILTVHNDVFLSDIHSERRLLGLYI